MPDLKTIPLHDQHLEAGAVFGEHRGAEVPIHYGNAAEEYQAIRHGAAILDFSHLAKFEISGKDAADYLQRMTSNEVVALEPGSGCHNSLLTDRGKLVTDFRLFRQEEQFRLHFDPLQREAFREPMERFIIMDEVNLRDVTEELGILAVHGPKSGDLLRSVFKLDMPPMQEFQHFEAFFAGEDLLVACQQILGEDGYEIWVPNALAEELWRVLVDAANTHDGRPAGFEAFNIARIESGVPLFGFDMDDTTIPNEAGLDHIASVTKGCYIGQEIISRIHHLGHVNRILSGLKFEGDALPSHGDEVKVEGRKIGAIGSAVKSLALNCGIGLAILRSKHAEPGTAVTVESGGSTIKAEMGELPFVKGKT